MTAGPSGASPPGLSLLAVLGHVRTTFLKKPINLYGLSYLANIPLLVSWALIGGDLSSLVHRGLLFGCYVILYLGQALIISYIFELNRRQEGSLKEAVRRVVGVVWPLLGLGLIIGLLYEGSYTVLPRALPEIVLGTLLAVAVPACLMEGRGAVAGIRRSLDLTRGSRLKILLLVTFVYAVNYFIIYRLIIIQVWELAVLSPLSLALLSSALYAVTYLIFYLVYAAVYYELRTIEYFQDNSADQTES